MKTLSTLAMLVLALGSIHAQADKTEYYQRLYYTCKVWGYAKYFHQNLRTEGINWDQVLLNSLDGVKSAGSDEQFNQSLLTMLEQAGAFQTPTGALPEVHSSLRRNIDLGWFDDPLIQADLKDMLLQVDEHFRPTNHWLLQPGATFEISFQGDSSYYQSNDFPTEKIRLLGLFRYWNIINYFFPYKYIMDQDWDSTLVEFIPAFVNAGDALAYNLAFKHFTTRINDSHALFRSPVHDELSGMYHAPFLARNIEEKLVITRVLPGIEDVSPGDIILEIDSRKVGDLLDSVRRYTAGSNPTVIEKYAYEGLIKGHEGAFQVLIDHGNKSAQYTFTRNAENYALLTAPSEQMWKEKELINGSKVRMVDMGSLTPESVDELFSFHSGIDAYIFDVRNKPRNTLFPIADRLFPKRIRNANFLIPEPTYPGTYYWYLSELGQGTSKPYLGQVIILMNENTRSHSEYTCMGLELYPGATKIGFTTAAADGNVSWMYLPGKIHTAFTNLGVFYPDGTETQRVGIVPDMIVRPTIQGIREGRDEVMEAALILLGGTSKEEISREEIHIYPNPAGEVLHYSFTSAHPGSKDITIRDVSGKIIREYTSLPLSGNISLEGLPPGMYIVETKNQGLKKLVKY